MVLEWMEAERVAAALRRGRGDRKDEAGTRNLKMILECPSISSTLRNRIPSGKEMCCVSMFYNFFFFYDFV